MDISLRYIIGLTLILFSMYLGYQLDVTVMMIVVLGILGAYLIGTMRPNVLSRLKRILLKLKPKSKTPAEPAQPKASTP